MTNRHVPTLALQVTEAAAALEISERSAKRGDEFCLANRLALSIKEAAEVLGVSEGLLRTSLPEIPHLHVGTRVVIPVDALRDWLRTQAQAEAGAAAQEADDILDSLK